MDHYVELLQRLHKASRHLRQEILTSAQWEAHLKLATHFTQELCAIVCELTSRQRWRDFGQREDDIYIATFPKSGTTWLQMILYQLTTDGDMSFRHIYDVSPFVDWMVQEDGPLPSVPSPRILKTHETYENATARKGRFIYSIRNGLDTIFSQHKARQALNHPKARWDAMFEESLGYWCSHLAAWMDNKRGVPILYVRYEDMLADLPSQIDRIVQFCGLKVSAPVLRRTLQRSTFKFMKRHESKFGTPQRQKIIYNQFIRHGVAGDGTAHATDAQRQQYELALQKHFSPQVRAWLSTERRAGTVSAA